MKYYFIQDKIEKGEVEIKYCPTENMWSNILTKPKQGKGFQLMWAELMNCPVDCEDKVYNRELDEIFNGFDFGAWLISSG